MNKLIVAGHICLDITPVFESDQALPIEKRLIPGSLVQMNGVNVAVGGAVSNTGIALKLLGSDVTLMGLVGRDDFGRLVRERYSAFQADARLTETDKAGTSYSVVLAAPGNDRIFLHDPGTNNVFDPSALDYEAVAAARLFHFGYPPLMRRMYEGGGALLTDMFRQVKALGVLTSLDMAAVDADSPAGKADWKRILENTLPYVDYFVPSLDEIALMLGYDLTGDPRADSALLAETLISMGARAVMVKCGHHGIRLVTGEWEGNPGWSGKSLFQACFTPRRVRSATGAGDTAIAAFLKAACEGYAPQEALALAAATGACCVEEYDAVSGLLPFPELKKRFGI